MEDLFDIRYHYCFMYNVYAAFDQISIFVCVLFDQLSHWTLIDVTFILDFIFPFVKWIKYINWNRHYAYRFKSFIIKKNPDRQSEINVILFQAHRTYYTFIHLFISFLFRVLFCSFRNRRTSLYDYSILNSTIQLKNFIFFEKFYSFWFPFTTIYQLPIK